MSADQLRHKAQQRQSKARFDAIRSILIGLVLSTLFGWAFAQENWSYPRLGWGVLSIWSLYFAYQTYKWLWPGAEAPDANLSATLESYRCALERRRNFGRRIVILTGLPFCFLGLALIVAPELIKSIQKPRLVWDVAPVCVLFAFWLALFSPLRKRTQNKLDQEIEELRAFENQTRR
jgi:hypothetical protein